MIEKCKNPENKDCDNEAERTHRLVEIAHMLFVVTPIELRVLILASLIVVAYAFYKKYLK